MVQFLIIFKTTEFFSESFNTSKTFNMKTNAYLLIVITGLFFTGCIQDTIEGPPGQDGRDGLDGRDGNANVYCICIGRFLLCNA